MKLWAAMNAAMKRGMQDGTFWAVEAGHVVGRPQCHLPRGVVPSLSPPLSSPLSPPGGKKPR